MKIIRKESRVRIELSCEHKSGTVYMVPSESSWVCKDQNLDSHALSGFLSDIVKVTDPKILELMQKWGIYYRDGINYRPDEDCAS